MEPKIVYKICRNIVNIINFIWFKFKIVGKENIPKSGGAIICPNHLSLYDPCVIGSITNRYIHFMAKAELFKNPFSNWFFRQMRGFPVDRDHVGIETVKTALKLLKDDKILGIFPEGTRIKEGKRIQPANGFVVFAIKTRKPIIPIHIMGEYGFRKKVRVVIGQPIFLDDYYGKKLTEEEMKNLSQEVMDQVYALE